MNHTDQLFIETLELWHILAIIISVTAFMMLYMKANRTDSLRAFLYVQMTTILWMFFKMLKTVAPTIGIRWACIVLQYLAICLLEVAFLEFGYAYYKGVAIKKKTKLLLYIPPLFQFIVLASNPYHHLFYSHYDFWGDHFGIMFYFHFFIEYIYIFIGAVFCGIKFKNQFKNRSRLSIYLIATGILAPIILNLIYVSKILHKFFKIIHFSVIFDITPLVFTWSLLLFVYATFKNEFFELSPIMKHEIIYKLDTPLCITDVNQSLLFSNERLITSLKMRNAQELENFLKHHLDNSFSSTTQFHNQTLTHGDRHYEIHLKRLYNFSGTKNIITFNDITSYTSLKNQLIEKKEELDFGNTQLTTQIETLKRNSRIGARNYVSRELHDIIGHSLVVTIKLLEVAKLFSKKDAAITHDSLKKAQTTIRKGFYDMEFLKKSQSTEKLYTETLLEQELGKMLKGMDVLGIQTRFYFKGNKKSLNAQIYETIKKICMELLTNTLKHSKASQILFSFNHMHDRIQITIMDDGIGRKKILKGNGLIGIEQRVASVNGIVEYNSGEGEGFNTLIYIPTL